MGVKNLKNINGAPRPINTISSRSSNKLKTASVSPFFTQKRSTIKLQDKLQDLVSTNSHDDIYDIKSNSSSGYLTPAATTPNASQASLHEYRNAKVKETHKSSRVRKYRSNSRQVIRNTMITKRLTSQSPDSPDVLAVDDDNQPPPANVVSDVHVSRRGEKRLRPPPSHDAVHPLPKRRRAESVEDSEDELNRTMGEQDHHEAGMHGDTSTAVRPFPRCRGDISPTVFRRKDHDPDPLQSGEFTEMRLIRAVSGSLTYVAAKDSLGGISLCQAHNNKLRLEPRTRDGEKPQLDWLEVDLNTVKKMKCGADGCPIVVLYRPLGTKTPPILVLEFVDPRDAVGLAHLAEACEIEESSLVVLSNTMNACFKRAATYNAAKADSEARSATIVDPKEDSSLNPTQAPSEIVKDVTKPEKIKDKMIRLAESTGRRQLDLNDFPDNNQPIATRRTRRSSPVTISRRLSPERWTTSHPQWRQQWRESLVYPATGKNRATVDLDDIMRLDEGEFLNDNLISFYMRYLQIQLESTSPEVCSRVYFFNTFFFEKLRSGKGRINYQGVKAWTAKIDLFSYDYMVVPVNENAHWYLAIICNMPKAVQQAAEKEGASIIEAPPHEPQYNLRSSPMMSVVERRMSDVSLNDTPRKGSKVSADHGSPSSLGTASTKTLHGTPPVLRTKKSVGGGTPKPDPGQPKIITLDSLGAAHAPTSRALKDYLVEEGKDKKGIDLSHVVPSSMSARWIPQQDNFCDCGIFVLGYMEEFLKDPDEAVRKLLQKEKTGWNIQPSHLRNKIRAILFELQLEQQDRRAKLSAEKQKKKKKLALDEKLESSPIARKSSGDGRSNPREEALLDKPTTPSTNKGSTEGHTKSHSGVKGELSTGIDTPSEYYTARSSPSKPVLNPPATNGEVVNPPSSSSESRLPLDAIPEVKFVEPLPNSPTSNPEDMDVVEQQRQMFVRETRAPSPPKKAETSFLIIDDTPVSPALQSIEIDDTSEIRPGPQYDGIDRSRVNPAQARDMH